MTNRYLTPPFAEELAVQMGSYYEREKLPGPSFVEEALKPPPLYFETEETSYKGVCCVCFKKGCLGKCPNSQCGLLMHHSCVRPPGPGEDQQCPVCRTDIQLRDTGDLPF